MPRIRTIKPEFWDSPSTKDAGPWARLLYIAMWNWADDHGRGTANLKEMEGFAFPNDDRFTDRSGNTVHFRDLVAEVSECFDVVFYEADGRPYYAILGWDKHQRNERRSKQSRHPEPPSQSGSSGNTVHFRDLVAETPRTSVPGTGEQGNRGTDSRSSAAADAVSDSTFTSWWSLYPRKVGKGQAVKAYRAALKKTTAKVLADSIADQSARLMAKGVDYCPHPATWLNGERWLDEPSTETEPRPRSDISERDMRPFEGDPDDVEAWSEHRRAERQRIWRERGEIA